MDRFILIVQFLALLTGGLAALLSILLFIRLRWPAPVLWFLKLYVSALSPVFLLLGLWSILAGLTSTSMLISLTGLYVSVVYGIHIIRITGPPDPSAGFEKAFGLNWEDRIHPEQKRYFLPGRRTLFLAHVPLPGLEQNVSFSVIPGSSRTLLCDIWRPPPSVSPSGLAFIYIHGAAWYMLDKDLGTRPLFRHLAAQGHLIMDVANRLAPETDLPGMVGDLRRAVVWMKEHAGQYGVNPKRIVLGGGSSGAHLALLAAFTAAEPQFIPEELEGKDLSICAVISLYGPADLEAMYYHTQQHLTTRSTAGRPKKSVPTQLPGWIIKAMGKEYHRLGMDKGFENAGAIAHLLGGHPDECPERYALFSPLTHVHRECPPTLLIHGEHDLMAPVSSTRILFKRLLDEKIPVVMHIIPQTDHAFDLQLPKISPSAHAAIYDIERFLALQSDQYAEAKISAERRISVHQAV